MGAMMTSLVGKTVLITGAARGIGRLMALGAARRGATLVLWGIHQEPLELVAKEIENEGGTAHTYLCDVGDRSAVEFVADQVRRDGLRVDVLVNNAGVVAGRYFLDLTEEDIERTFRVNALAHYWTTRAFLPGMVERDSGHIVTIASVAGLFGIPRTTAYSGSKHAVVGFHESLRLELRRVAPGIRTTLVCPGHIDTGMFEGVKVRSRLIPTLHSEDVAEAVLRAVERNRFQVLMPPITHLIRPLRILPPAAFDTTLRILGVASSMDHFVGRHGHA